MSRRIATADHVGWEELLEFVRPRHHHVVISTRSDGRPQASPVSAGIGPQDHVLIATYPQRAKVANLRRDPRVSLVVLSDDWNGAWVQLDGTAEIVDLPEAVEPLVDYYRSISGEHPDWEEYRRAMVDQGKCLLRITIEDWGPIATGGFPPELVANG